MINNSYAKAYTEVLEIISHFPKEEYFKIPQEEIDFYQKNMDKDYDFSIDPEKDLAEQNISSEAKAIIVNIYRDYFATEEQKNKIKEILDLNQRIEEQRKHGAEDIFKNVNKDTKTSNIEKTENNTNTALQQYEESFFARFKKFIFKIFQINK